MAKYKNYHIGCTDPYGNNAVGDELNNTIAAVCAKYKVSARDFDTIATAFSEAVSKAYSNGYDNAEFENEEY